MAMIRVKSGLLHLVFALSSLSFIFALKRTSLFPTGRSKDVSMGDISPSRSNYCIIDKKFVASFLAIPSAWILLCSSPESSRAAASDFPDISALSSTLVTTIEGPGPISGMETMQIAQQQLKKSQPSSPSSFSISGGTFIKLDPARRIQPPDVAEIMRDRFAMLRSGITGEKVNKLRVGESLVGRLRGLEQELDAVQADFFRDPPDWDVLDTYPKVFRAYAPLFTAYTDRAFPNDDPVDESLRYALRYEVGSFYTGVQDLEKAIELRNPRQAQRAFAKMSLAYDHYLKAGDLYDQYDEDEVAEERSQLQTSITEQQKRVAAAASKGGGVVTCDIKKTPAECQEVAYEELALSQLKYIAPSIEAPGLQDTIVFLKGPDKGRTGTVLWISKGENLQPSSVIVKLDEAGASEHREVKAYPYSIVAKTTPPDVQFLDDFVAAYLASAISSGIMYPIDSFKTRIQTGKRGIPSQEEGGIVRLWSGVQWFILDANDAVYIASYGLLKSFFLAPVDPTNALAVFSVLVLAGSIGDAFGSVFRVPCEIIYKRIQTGAATAADGDKVLMSLVKSPTTGARVVALSWTAVLLRDMPFAGLQIAFYDIFKGLLAFLDDYGTSMFVQRALWGACAGLTAAFLTTPFDLLTTNVMTEADVEAEQQQQQEEEGEKLLQSKNDMVKKGGRALTTIARQSMSSSAPTTVAIAGAATTSSPRSSSSSLVTASLSSARGITKPSSLLPLSSSSSSSSPASKLSSASSSSSSSSWISTGTTIRREGRVKLLLLPTPPTDTDIRIPPPLGNNEKELAVSDLPREIVQLFSSTLLDTLQRGGLPGLFTGAVPRMLFFAPAAMIFFAAYESIFELIAAIRAASALD